MFLPAEELAVAILSIQALSGPLLPFPAVS